MGLLVCVLDCLCLCLRVTLLVHLSIFSPVIVISGFTRVFRLEITPCQYESPALMSAYSVRLSQHCCFLFIVSFFVTMQMFTTSPNVMEMSIQLHCVYHCMKKGLDA